MILADMRILILTTGYPTPESIYDQAFVRARVRGYREAGVQVTVLSFRTARDYEFDGVPIVSRATVVSWGDLRERFDVIASHAPNLRQHLRFLLPRAAELPPVVFTFHGHETMRIHRHYPAPFPWARGRFFAAKRSFQEVYDTLKLWALKWGIEHLIRHNGVSLVYVSQAMKDMAFGDLGVDSNRWSDRCSNIPNPVGPAFETAHHHCSDPLGDFVTIRPLDVSKMAIDLVVECARQNPNKIFHVYGKGRALNFLDPPSNLVHFDHFLENDQIPTLLNRYRAALMPSRCDAQGVMMCEMASLGMPVVASDIPAHREALDNFPRTTFLDNTRPRLDADSFLAHCQTDLREPPSTYHQDRVIGMEIALFRSLSP